MSRAAVKTPRPYRRREDVITEVEFLLADRSPASISDALGYARPANVARVLYRAGRPDLARPFNVGQGAARRAA